MQYIKTKKISNHIKIPPLSGIFYLVWPNEEKSNNTGRKRMFPWCCGKSIFCGRGYWRGAVGNACLKSDSSLIGAMAIENTIAGSLLQNHELLRQSNLTVVGEYKMRISHVLCALPGQNIDELTEVNSHPMALMQCEQFLHRHPNLKMVEKTDTAGSAEGDMLPFVESWRLNYTAWIFWKKASRQTSVISQGFLSSLIR